MNNSLQRALNVTPTSKSKYRQELLSKQKLVVPSSSEMLVDEEAVLEVEAISRQILNQATRGNPVPKRRIMIQEEDDFEIISRQTKNDEPLVKGVAVEQSPVSKEPRTIKSKRPTGTNIQKLALETKMMTPPPPTKRPVIVKSPSRNVDELPKSGAQSLNEFDVIANPNESTSWNTKYIPRSLGINGDFAGHQDVIIKMKKWLIDHKNRVPQTKKAAMLIGPPGIGKTSLVFALAQQLGYEYEEFNPFSDVAPVGSPKGMKAASYLELNVIPRMAYRIDRPTIVQLESADTFGSSEVFKSLYLTETGQKKKKNNSMLSAPLQLATAHFKTTQETVKVHPNGTKYFATTNNEEIYPHPLVLTANEKNESFSQLAGYCEIFYMDRLPHSTIADRLQQICAAEKLHTTSIIAWNKEVVDQKTKAQFNREMHLNEVSPLQYDQVFKGDMLETDVSNMVIKHVQKHTTVGQDLERLATDEFGMEAKDLEELLAKHSRNTIECATTLIGDFRERFQSRYCASLLERVIRDTRSSLSAWKMLREETTSMLKHLISLGFELDESERALNEAKYDLKRTLELLMADEGMRSLVSLGFSVNVAREALTQSQNQLDVAKDLLYNATEDRFHKKYFTSDTKVQRRTAIYREIRIFDLDRTYTSRRLPPPTICHLIAANSNGDLRRAILLLEICSYIYRNHEARFPKEENHFEPEACMTVIFEWSLQDTSPHAHSTFQYKELCDKPIGFRQLSDAFDLTAGYVEQIMHTHLYFLISSSSSKLRKKVVFKDKRSGKETESRELLESALMTEVADLWAIADNFENDVFSGGRGEAFVYKKVFGQVMPLAVIKEALTLNFVPLYFSPKKVSSDFSGVDMQQLTGAAMFGMPRAKHSMMKHMFGAKSALVKADCLPPPSPDLFFYRANFVALFKSVWSDPSAMHIYVLSWLEQNSMPVPTLATVFRLASTFLGRCESFVDARHFKKQKTYAQLFRDGALNSEITAFLTEHAKRRHLHSTQMKEVPTCMMPEFESRSKECDGFVPMVDDSLYIENLDDEAISTASSEDILEKLVESGTQLFSTLDVFLKRTFTLRTLVSDKVNDMLLTLHTSVKKLLFTRCKDEKTGKDFFFIGAWFSRVLELQTLLQDFQLFYARRFLAKHPAGVIHAFVTTLKRFEDHEIALTKSLVMGRTQSMMPIQVVKKRKAANEMFFPESSTSEQELREIIRFDLERSLFALTFVAKHLNDTFFCDLDKFSFGAQDEIQNLIVGPERPTAQQLAAGLTSTDLIRVNYSFADRLLFCEQVQSKLGYSYATQNTFHLISKKELFSVRMERGYKSSSVAKTVPPVAVVSSTKKRSFEQNEAASTKKKRKPNADEDLGDSPCFSMQENTIAVLPSKIKTPTKKVTYSFDF